MEGRSATTRSTEALHSSASVKSKFAAIFTSTTFCYLGATIAVVATAVANPATAMNRIPLKKPMFPPQPLPAMQRPKTCVWCSRESGMSTTATV